MPGVKETASEVSDQRRSSTMVTWAVNGPTRECGRKTPWHGLVWGRYEAPKLELCFAQCAERVHLAGSPFSWARQREWK